MISKISDQKRLQIYESSNFESLPALFLDIDGTLLEIADKPNLVVVSPSLKQLLFNLKRYLSGALVLITGRTIADVDQLFHPYKFAVSGKHGSERRDTSGYIYKSKYKIHSTKPKLFASLQSFVKKNQGTVLENKGETLAIHYRLNPDIETTAKAFIYQLVARHSDLEILEGKMVLEIKKKGYNKGDAIKQFMMEQPFVERTPYFFGDDFTDENGFQVINSIRGVSVCVDPKLESVAKFKLENVSSVINWLEKLADNFKKKSA